MNKILSAFIATAAILFFACGSKTDVDFSIVPVKGTNGEYQYIDVAQKGKIVINPQFEQAYFFKDDLARVKVSGGKWGYIDKNGKYVIAPTYDDAQDFSDGVAWVKLKNEPFMLIDKSGKMILQLVHSSYFPSPFKNDIAIVYNFSKRILSQKFINKKGEDAVTQISEGEDIDIINEGLYAFKSKGSEKWGYKNKKGEVVISEQFDIALPFIEGVAVVSIGEKEKSGVINKEGEWLINPQYDGLDFDSDGLFQVKVGEKWGWINKKSDTVINPQFDSTYGFLGNKLAPVKMGRKWGYIDKKGQILINPQFEEALPFNGNYAMVVNDGDKIGFIDQKGDFIVSPLYDRNRDYEDGDVQKYLGVIYIKIGTDL